MYFFICLWSIVKGWSDNYEICTMYALCHLQKTQKLSGQPFIVNFTFEMVGMEWGMDHLAWRGPKYKYRCKNVIETQCLLSPMHACKYRINLARNMLCVMWQIQMEALKEIKKSKKKLTQYPSDHQTERRCPDICWPRMIDIQHKVANQDGLYEVVVNGEGDGDLRVISVSRTIFSKLP